MRPAIFVRAAAGAVLAAAAAGAGDPIAYESLAFFPDPAAGPEATVPGSPFPKWTRVAFAPRIRAGFPEELRPLREFAAPGRDLRGIAVAADGVWVATGAPARLHRLDRAAGRPLGSIDAPGSEPAGLTWDGSLLWLGDRSGKVFAVEPGGAVRRSFAVAFVPAALARDGGALLASDAASDRLHVLDAETGAEIRAEPAPEKAVAGLARSAAGAWWCAAGSELIRVDRDRGLPVCGFSALPPHPARCSLAGLAADGGELWIADRAGGRLAALREPAHGEIVAAAGRHRKVLFAISYANRSRAAWDDPVILQHVPFLEMPGHRYLSLEVRPAPFALFRDELGNAIAAIRLGRVEAGASARVEVTAAMWVADRRMVIDPGRLAGAPSGDRANLLAPFAPIEGWDDPAVAAFVRKAVGDETNPYWRIRLAHDALCRAVRYREPRTDSVPRVLELGYGVCRNFSAFLQAAGRQLGVPVLNSWAPRHETCFWMLPGAPPAIMEVTADDLARDAPTAWARSRWVLGTYPGEITTGVRGPSMHATVLLDGRPFVYGWHHWRPAGLEGLAAGGSWKVTWEARGRADRR